MTHPKKKLSSLRSLLSKKLPSLISVTSSAYIPRSFAGGSQPCASVQGVATYASALEEFRRRLMTCKQHHVDLRLFFSPTHVLHHANWSADRWQAYEQWMREVLRIFLAECRRALE
jgi:hypothetical protein